MKKLLSVWMILLLLTGCSAGKAETIEAQPTPAVLIGNYTYYWTGIEVKELPDRGVSGHICSVVPATSMPTRRDEANIGAEDAPYIYLDDGIALLLNGQWIFFKPE